jgi:peptidoglycan/xylan/chitin deacetylase (PgdA/CDA1 family)
MPRRLLILLVVVLTLALGQAGCSGSWRSSPAEESAARPSTPAPVSPSPPTTVIAWLVPGAVRSGVRPPVITSASAAVAGTAGDAVALTFDADLTPAMRQRLRDGKVESYANMAVIDILEETGTPATIFFTGLWMEEYPDETRQIVADSGFELATHSQTHRAFRSGCYGLGVVPPAEMADEVRTPMKTLAGFTDRVTHYFRFPGLCHDDAALAGIAPAGVTVVDGDSSGDAGGRSVDAIVDQTLRTAHPGSIIVLHLNGGDAAPLTDEALPRIIDGLYAKGLRPTTLTDLLGPAPAGNLPETAVP